MNKTHPSIRLIIMIATVFLFCGWNMYAEAEAIKIPEEVTVIEAEAFANDTSITEVIIPDGVKQIEANAFSGCINLKRISIPGSVNHIEENAFSGCDSILVIGTRGSYAEEWCAQNNVQFQGDTSAYKIAIMTGTTSQGEEEVYAAQKLADANPGKVLHDVYPDNYISEVETTISKLIGFASDPEVKAIIFVQAVQGATAAYTQILNNIGRDDILLIAGVPAEIPGDISAAADIVLANDEIRCGYQVADLANGWGCDVLVHYSFARHLSYETIVAKRNVMKMTAEAYGIEFVERDCPDPIGDAGMSGARAAVLEDIPKVMQEYEGKKVCFYCTNCGLQVALQQAIVNESNAYYALPCCPSPYHGFQEAFGLTASYDDIQGAIKSLAVYLNEHNAIDRFSTWVLPVNMSMINAGYQYACLYAEGKTNGKLDKAVLEQCFANATGGPIALESYMDAEGKAYDNYLLIAMDPINFASYLK